MASECCCTCATLLCDTKVPYDTESEKPICLDRRLECCHRTICATCQYDNVRFQSYCPFCQISSGPSKLPATGLRLPPSYASTSRIEALNDAPPSYASIERITEHAPQPPETEDVVHFLNSEDTVSSISLAYKVPIHILRQQNRLNENNLLAARKWILIPRSHYQGPPLSTPPDAEEEARKNKLRRWMVATKCANYDVATLYLKGSDYSLELAVEAFKADEQWERDHPIKGNGKGKSTRRPEMRSMSFGMSGQLT